jgi:hypothetical protein
MTGLEVARARNLSPTLIAECAGYCKTNSRSVKVIRSLSCGQATTARSWASSVLPNVIWCSSSLGTVAGGHDAKTKA